MTISLHIIAIPAAVVALASFVALRDDASFRDSTRTSNIQVGNKSRVPAAPGSVIATQDPSLRLSNDRYGWDENSPQASPLGRDVPVRPLGTRAETRADWLATQQPVRKRVPTLPDITGYEEPVTPLDPLAQPLAAESGYQITAEEVSRLDTTTGRVTFNKNVRLISPQFHLTSDQLVVHLGKDKSTMELLEAHGNVNVLLTGVPPEKAYRGQSRDATFDPKADKIVLTGWPKVKGANQEQVAADADTRMTLFSKTGRIVTDGRAQTRIAKSFMDESTGAKK